MASHLFNLLSTKETLIETSIIDSLPSTSNSTTATVDPARDFITLDSSSGILVDGFKRPFRFITFNYPSMMQNENVPGYKLYETPEYELEDAFSSIAQIQGKLLRSYTFSICCNESHSGMDASRYAIPALRTYNETMFVVLDRALAQARKFNVRVLIPFIDWWNWRGGVQEFAAFRGKSRWEFFSDPEVKEDFKDLIRTVILRKNTITGVVYKDDPLIFGWELGNELGGWFGMAPSSWVLDMSAFIKSLDSNHLVVDGAFAINFPLGKLEGFGHDFFLPMDTKLDVYRKAGVLASPHIDMFRDHYYVADDDGDYSRRSLDIIRSLEPYGKAFAVTEVGFSSSTTMRRLFTTIVDTPRITGAAVWSLRTHSILGGYYVHKEKDSWLSYRLPGYQGCSLFIRWRGSAMAYEYKIARSVLPLNATDDGEGPPLEWQLLDPGFPIQDATYPGLAIFSDTTAPCHTRLFYSIAAVSEGGWSEWSQPESVIDACPDEDWELGSPLSWEFSVRSVE
ncbi:glycoside hydrolase superfamily [Chytridium lagenaria]|nr:glycoside hydrolase superfamily [Chytridium lagenaria]